VVRALPAARSLSLNASPPQRLAWHAAGTYATDGSGGSTGCRMRFSPEKDWGANAGLGLARGLLEPVKRAHPGVSYADLYALAGVVAIQAMGGPAVAFRAGRADERDGARSPPDGRLPDAAQGAAHLRSVFGRMGFSDAEIVALSGAHALGRCHTDRSGFVGPWTRSPTTFSNAYFTHLLEDKWIVKCAACVGSASRPGARAELSSPPLPRRTKHNGLPWTGPRQFVDAKTGELMMLPSDLALIQDKAMLAHVERYAKDAAAFRADFAAAFGKLLELGVAFPSESKPIELRLK
jgi:cytochrome c peroxidase